MTTTDYETLSAQDWFEVEPDGWLTMVLSPFIVIPASGKMPQDYYLAGSSAASAARSVNAADYYTVGVVAAAG